MVPCEDDFRLLLEVCFQATLRTEEGRTVASSVTWLTPDELVQFEIHKLRSSELALRFREPIILEARTLAKLSHVANGYSTTLLAARLDGSPVIWGLLHFASPSRPLAEIPCGGDMTWHFAPDALMVTTTGVGSLRISRQSSVVGRIEHGQFFVAEPTPLISSGLLPFVLALEGICLPEGSTKYVGAAEAGRARTFEHCLEFLLGALARQSGGATLVFLPPARAPDTLPFAGGFQCAGSLEIDQLRSERLRIAQPDLGAILNDHRLPKEWRDYLTAAARLESMIYDQRLQKGLRDRLVALARLGICDGAVIIKPVFNPISFGAKLIADRWQGRAVERNAFGAENQPTVKFERLGTRHHSALNFVAAVPGSIAFVASEDGPIRGLVRANADEVWYWPDCRLSMFM